VDRGADLALGLGPAAFGSPKDMMAVPTRDLGDFLVADRTMVRHIEWLGKLKRLDKKVTFLTPRAFFHKRINDTVSFCHFFSMVI
jgi:hypothetical protein